MAGEIQWGILDPTMPGKIAGSFNAGLDEYRKNALQDLVYKTQAQQVADDAATRDAYRQSGGDMNSLQKLLAGQGLYKQSAEIAKQQLGQRAKEATIGKDQSVTAENQQKIALGRINWIKNGMTSLGQNPTEANAVAILQDGVKSGIMTTEQAAEQIGLMRSHPEGIPGYVKMKTQELTVPKPHEMDLNGSRVVIDLNPLSPTFGKQMAAMDKMQSPDSVATNKLGYARLAEESRHNKAAEGQGRVPAGYRANPDGTMMAIPGGPADLKAQALDQQKAIGASDVDSAIATLRDAYDRLEIGGGITSTKNSGLSNIPSSVSSSGIGQAVGKALGTNNQSARNDIAMTRPALLAALMKATGMSAKQMDSNAELKLWLATATDPTLDVESNRRALDAIERKYVNVRGGQVEQVGKPPQNQDRPIKINNDAEYNALPAGSVFIGPDGKTRRKP